MKYFFLFFVFVSPILCQTWASLGKFENFSEYFTNLVQETIYELERREWCNLKPNDISVNVSEKIYDKNFEGNVQFNNGFLVSMQNIDLSNITQNFFTGSISGITTGSMEGKVNFRDVVVGYDVIANLEDLGIQRFTGTYLYTLIVFEIRIQKNFHTGEITATAEVISLSAGNVMVNKPENEIGDALSRYYVASSARSGINSWGGTIIAPYLLELIKKTGFPDVCFNHCPS